MALKTGIKRRVSIKTVRCKRQGLQGEVIYFIKIIKSVGKKPEQLFRDKSLLKIVCFFSLIPGFLGKNITSTHKYCLSSMLRQALKTKYFCSSQCF